MSIFEIGCVYLYSGLDTFTPIWYVWVGRVVTGTRYGTPGDIFLLRE